MSDDVTQPDLESLARAVAEGEAVDWEHWLGRNDLAPALVDNLRALQALAATFGRVRPERESWTTQELSLPAKWQHLTLLEEIGSGTFGRVYRAHDTMLERTVALKLMRLQQQEIDADAWIAEARRMARVRHPNVLAVHGAGADRGQAGLWADLIDGAELGDWLQQSRTSSWREAVLSISQQLAGALQAVHRAGLVHGDVKPNNIVIDRDNHLTLMDFGAGSDRGSGDPVRTGTPAYLAPEIMAGGAASRAADWYAYGIVLQRALDAVPKLDQDLRALAKLSRALQATAPAARPTGDAVLATLERLVKAPQRRRNRYLLSAVIGSLLIGMALSLVGFLRADQAADKARAAQREAEQITQFLVQVLAAPRGNQLGIEARVVDVLKQGQAALGNEFAEPSLARARLNAALGETYLSRRAFDAAAKTLAQGLADFETFGATRHPAYLQARLAHGRLALAQQHTALAVERLQGALEDCATTTCTLSVLPYLALAHIDDGAIDAAQARLDQLRTSERQPSPMADFVAHRLLIARGEFAVAVETGEPLLARLVAQRGGEDDRTLSMRINLAQAYARIGQAAKAEPLIRAGIEPAKALYGPSHKRAIAMEFALANLLTDQHRNTEAITLFERLIPALAGSEISLIDRLIMRSSYATALSGERRFDEAVAIYEDVVDSARAAGMGEHPAVAIALINAAEIHLLEDRYDIAELNAMAATAVLVPRFGPDHPLSMAADALALAARDVLNPSAQTLLALRQRYRQLIAAVSEQNLNAINIGTYLAQAYERRGDQAAAYELWHTARRARAQQLGDDHPATRAASEALVRLR